MQMKRVTIQTPSTDEDYSKDRQLGGQAGQGDTGTSECHYAHSSIGFVLSWNCLLSQRPCLLPSRFLTLP